MDTEQQVNLPELYNYCLGGLQQFIISLTHHKPFQNPFLNNLWMKINQSLSMEEEVYFNFTP